MKYSKPVDDLEAGFRFVLLTEPEKGRVDIQLICDERIRREKSFLWLGVTESNS